MKQRIVVKVGSLVVTDETGGASPKKINRIIADLYDLKNQGYLPLLISSGAINTARGFIKKPDEKKMMVSYQQALAAIGQPLLMKAYIDALTEFKWPCAQILVTHEDFKDKKRFLNIRNTINTLLDNGILPIVNENDTVSFAEITVGDNDQLAVMMTQAADAEILILLSEADGLFNKNPKDKNAIHFEEVDFRDDFKNVTIAAKTNIGRGGMDTKLKAVRKLTPLGVDVVLGSYLHEKAISRLLFHKGGTKFKGNPIREHSRRKSWLSTLVKNDCYLIIDEGAFKAILNNHTSLLPVGIKKVHGKFKRGEVIQIRHKNKVLAVGISEYDNTELNLIKGKRSLEINELLNIPHSKVAIHKDNLLLKKDELL
ncbi:MAG: glutamate 5-kinase [Pseudobdellovibrio sp.]